MTRGLFDNFDSDYFSRCGIAHIFWRHQNVVLDALVFRNNQQNAALRHQSSNQAIGFTFRDLNNGSFGLATVVGAGNSHQHAVAMQYFLHLARGKKGVWSAIITNQKTETVTVTSHSAGYEIKLGRKQQHALSVGH